MLKELGISVMLRFGMLLRLLLVTADTVHRYNETSSGMGNVSPRGPQGFYRMFSENATSGEEQVYFITFPLVSF